MLKHMKHTFSERAKTLEARRLKVAEYFKEGKSQAWVAARLGVARPSAWTWYHAWKKEGEDGLRARKPSGAPSRLSEAKLKKVAAALDKGPAAFGYDTELWTLQRIAAVVRKTVRVRYHPGHVWKILRDLGWTNQKPETSARERNEKAIRRWMRTTFPRIQKRGSQRGRSSVFSTNPVSPTARA